MPVAHHVVDKLPFRAGSDEVDNICPVLDMSPNASWGIFNIMLVAKARRLV